MKAFIITALLILIIGNIGAVDTQSYQFIDYLRAISAPRKPEIYENGVVFTASSSYQRVGISFAHEGYSRVHWFQLLVVPRDMAELTEAERRQKNVDPNIDSGIKFHLQIIPAGMQNMDYRLVIDGLWTADPLNPLTVTGPSGVVESRVSLPARSQTVLPSLAPPGICTYSIFTLNRSSIKKLRLISASLIASPVNSSAGTL